MLTIGEIVTKSPIRDMSQCDTELLNELFKDKDNALAMIEEVTMLYPNHLEQTGHAIQGLCPYLTHSQIVDVLLAVTRLMFAITIQGITGREDDTTRFVTMMEDMWGGDKSGDNK